MGIIRYALIKGFNWCKNKTESLALKRIFLIRGFEMKAERFIIAGTFGTYKENVC